jgi:hypothetical protein
MSQEIELLTEIRDLLHLIAEPALAKRDGKLRTALQSVAGKGQKARCAIHLMDGSRSQASIAKESDMDTSNLSKLVRSLTKKSLIADDEKHPKLVIRIPANFFDERRESDD